MLTNKYAEGYPGKRYYGGCEFADEVEALAIERVSRSSMPAANAAALGRAGERLGDAALAKPGDTVLGMSLDAGGHLTHGAKPALSGSGSTPCSTA